MGDVAGPPLVPVDITNRDKGTAPNGWQLLPPVFSPRWCNDPRLKGAPFLLES
jgi:hypothetical protein